MPDSHTAAAAPPEALLLCPECNVPLPARAYENHLREAHRRVIYRGRHYSRDDALAFLLNLLAGPAPEPDAWRALATLAAADYCERGDAFLAATLSGLLARVDGVRRGAAVESLANLLAKEGDGRLAAALAAEGEIAGRWLALALAARAQAPFDPASLAVLRSLLHERGLPLEAKFAAVACLIRSAGADGPLTAEFLGLLISGLGKARALDRLRRFERRFGTAPAVDALCAKLEARIRMTCPSCSAKLRRPAMMRHLWDKHRLVLDGRRVRDAWAVVEEWVEEYRKGGDRALLELCRFRGQQLDPADGLHRVHRLLLKSGADDPEARADLLAQARALHASLCPACFAPAPRPREAPPLEITLGRRQLSGAGYSVAIDTKGLWNILEVRTPQRLVYHGRGGAWNWTTRGATLFIVMPWVLLTLAAAFLWDVDFAPIVPVAFLAGAALFTQWIVRKSWPIGASPERLVGRAWTLLAPELHRWEFLPDDSAFLAGLALATPPGAFPTPLTPFLTALVERTEAAVSTGTCPPGHLAALHRLAVENAAARGGDPAALVADQVARCLQGRLPLAYAESLQTDWQSDIWTRGARARLRVLLCDRAFEAGFEVTTLQDAGRTGPSLGQVIGSDDAAGLAALRLLWSQRPTRPWVPCGPARTVFELAADPEFGELIGRRPDLLLWQREPTWVVAAEDGEEPMRPAEIMLCAGGVWLQDVRFSEAPVVVEETQTPFGGQLALGKHRFRGAGQIDALARRMERWFRFAFNDFLPATASTATWRSPERDAVLRVWGAAACPECGRYMLARVGNVGVALDESAP